MEIHLVQRKRPIHSYNLFVCDSAKIARIVMGIFLFGFFVDYSGGIGIKYAVFFIAFLWVLLNKNSLSILANRRSDFMVLIVTPLLIGILHFFIMAWFQYDDINLIQYSTCFYYTISSAVLIILYPLFKYVGCNTVLRQLSIGFRLVAITLITFYILNQLGIVDIQHYSEIFYKHRMGSLGGDPRLEDKFVGDSLKVIIAPSIAYPMVLMLGYELLRSPIAATLLIVSLIFLGSRGILIGAIAIMILMPLAVNRKSWKIPLLRYLFFSFIFLSIILMFELVRFRVTDVFLERTIQMMNVEDLSTQIRLGYFQGYANLIENNLFFLLFGAGPTGEIFNPVLNAAVSITEISILNTTLYFGVPYAVLYAFWFFRATLRLWRKRNNIGFVKEDVGLIFGAAFFWLIGNTNPQMNAPFAIFAFMLVNVRILEMKHGATSNPNNLHRSLM